MKVEPQTRSSILAAAKQALLESGYSRLSTRKIADTAGVPLSQIHYHFGSKQNLVLELLEEENRRLLQRQTDIYQSDMSPSAQWEQACDFLEDDLSSGYVRVLQEMTAAGWSEGEIAAAVRGIFEGWFELLTEAARQASKRIGGLGPFTPLEIAVLAGMPFLGVEAMILLGFDETVLPSRSALRKVGALLKTLEERDEG
jgi:AcrR family transcriptional regulator